MQPIIIIGSGLAGYGVAKELRKLIRAVALNTEGKLLTGAFATIALTLQEVENAILVPAAIFVDDGGGFVVLWGDDPRLASPVRV